MISRINHKVSILCRGSSLKYINKMNVCDTVLLVNSFHKELEEEDISNYVKKHPEVIHFVSPQSEFYSMVELEVYKDYNFTANNLPSFKSFRVKLVLTSTNQAYAPRFSNLKVITLA